MEIIRSFDDVPVAYAASQHTNNNMTGGGRGDGTQNAASCVLMAEEENTQPAVLTFGVCHKNTTLEPQKSIERMGKKNKKKLNNFGKIINSALFLLSPLSNITGSQYMDQGETRCCTCTHT